MEKKEKKQIWKKWWVWVIAVLVVIGISGGESKENKDKVDNTVEVAQSATNNNEQGNEENTSNSKEENKVEEEKSTKIKAGTYKVGADIPAGEYVVIAKKSGYIEVTADSTGEFSSIISNDNIKGNAYITVNDGEYLKIKNGEAYPVADAPSVVPEDGVYKDGMYLVGKDIEAGEYKVTLKSSMGYIEVNSNSSGTFDAIISNDNLTEDSYITIQDGQYLKLRGVEINTN